MDDHQCPTCELANELFAVLQSHCDENPNEDAIVTLEALCRVTGMVLGNLPSVESRQKGIDYVCREIPKVFRATLSMNEEEQEPEPIRSNVHVITRH